MKSLIKYLDKKLIFFFLISFFLTSCTNKKKSPLENVSIVKLGTENFSEKDIFSIIESFALSTFEKQNEILRVLYPKNKKLSETLILFRMKLNQVVNQEKNRKNVFEKVFLHYIVNKSGKLPVTKKGELVNVLELTKNYGQSMGISLADGLTKTLEPTLKLDDRTETCIDCNGNDYLALRNSGSTINKMRYGRPDVIPSSVYDFNSKISKYSLENAMILADFSNLAYFKKSFVDKQLKLWNYKFISWFEDKETDTQGFIAKKNNIIVVCFRGTSSITDASIDVSFFKVTAYGGKGKVHKGFQKALESVWPQLINGVDKKTKIFVTGHSLGAALASLAAYRLRLDEYNVAGVYVFGSPRVGNLEFTKTYDNLLKDKTFLHINNTDLVPTAPPEILGFNHLGVLRKFNKEHRISIIVKNKSDEYLEEKSFDQLNDIEKKKIKKDIRAVNKSIRSTTNFMKISPNALETFSYSTEFEDGLVDNHGIDQYLFKLACANVDKEWRAIEKSKK